MVQKGTKTRVVDRCGVWVVRTFHVYKGSFNHHAVIGDFTKASVRRTRPNNLITKGFKSKAILIRSCFRSARKDGSYVRLRTNGVVLLKKRMTPRGRDLLGPITYGIRRRRFVATFVSIV
jgi:ribosomal protein L14